MSRRFAAKLDEFTLDVESLDERHDHALVRKEYPLADGADLEDMGMKARELTLRCHFLNERIDEVEGFLWYLRQNNEVELTHPEFGVLRGRVESTSTRWTDADDAEIDIVFVEQMPDPESEYMPDLVIRGDEEFTAGQDELMQQITEDFTGQIGPDAFAVLAQTLQDGQTVLSQITGRIGFAARRALAAIDGAVSSFESLAATASNPADSIIQAVEYGSRLPGRVARTVAQTIERYAEAGAVSAKAPSQMLDSIARAGEEMVRAYAPWTSYVKVQVALCAGRYVAKMFVEDERARDILRAVEQREAFDVLGNRIETQEPPEVYTINELDATLEALTRLVQAAVDTARPCIALKRILRDTVEHVSTVKLERERIVTITVHGPQPLHLICHQLGLGFRAADRVLALNPQIANPNFVDGIIRVYAR